MTSQNITPIFIYYASAGHTSNSIYQLINGDQIMAFILILGVGLAFYWKLSRRIDDVENDVVDIVVDIERKINRL